LAIDWQYIRVIYLAHSQQQHVRSSKMCALELASRLIDKLQIRIDREISPTKRATVFAGPWPLLSHLETIDETNALVAPECGPVRHRAQLPYAQYP
jgi:hypothetical protein